jgi:hypothetical protein
MPWVVKAKRRSGTETTMIVGVIVFCFVLLFLLVFAEWMDIL